MSNRTWAKRCRALRAALGNVTQEEAARRLGVTVTTWSHWEQGRAEPRSRVIRQAVERLAEEAKGAEE